MKSIIIYRYLQAAVNILMRSICQFFFEPVTNMYINNNMYLYCIGTVPIFVYNFPQLLISRYSKYIINTVCNNTYIRTRS